MAGRPVVGPAPKRQAGAGRAVVGPAPRGGSQAKPKGGGGVGHFFKQLGSDLVNVAVHAPGGVAKIGETTYQQVVHGEGSPLHKSTDSKTPLTDLAAGTAKQVKSDLTHPLRHPGYTLLDLLPAANAGAKLTEAGRVAKAGEGTRAVVQAATRRPVYPARTLKRGSAEVTVGSSQSALGAAGQRISDKALQSRAASKPGGVADKVLLRKMGKAVTAEAGVIQNVHKASGAALIAAGRKLKPGEQKALQVVAEEAPLDKRITAASARVTGAKTPKIRARHQAELDLLHQAKPLLSEKGGKPVFAAAHEAKLGKILDTMRTVAGNREDLLKHLGQLTDEAIQGRKTKAARVAIGEPLQDVKGPSTEYRGNHTSPDAESGAPAHDLTGEDRIYPAGVYGPDGARIYGHGDPALDRPTLALLRNLRGKPDAEVTIYRAVPKDVKEIIPGDWVTPSKTYATMHAESNGEPGWHILEKKVPAREIFTNGDSIHEFGWHPPKPAPLFEASPNAVRIPDVATRRGVKSLSRNAGVGTAGTIGHLKAPGSVTHEYTGALRENAIRRQDTTALVGESAMESAKFAGLKHIHELVRKAATPEPQTASDIAVRLDKLKSHKRMPLEVRQFLDSPEEFFKTASPAEQASAFEGVRQRLFVNPKTLDPAAAAEFKKLKAEGKIGWVPKQLLGDLAKPHIPLSGGAVKTVDAINNASRFAILYLKPAYALPNLLGNAALNILQQGFAAVPNLKRAARLNADLGPDMAARIDTLMGEGFARAISSHGQGIGSAVVDKAASVWSKGVDIPFRRSSFLYEARRAGFDTPTKLEHLLTDPTAQQQLVDITQRANREVIDYANLSHSEREVVRRVVFFYPWVRGSTVYSARFLREHPVKAAALGQVGAIGKQNDLQTPTYLAGSFDVGGKLVNPTSAAILQTPAQVGQALAGLAGGDVGQVGQLANFASPASALALALASGRDRGGYQYKQKDVGHVAFDQLVKQTPQYLLGQRISDALSGSGQDRLYPPNIRDAVLQYVVGGIAPRKYNKDRLAALTANERSRFVP